MCRLNSLGSPVDFALLYDSNLYHSSSDPSHLQWLPQARSSPAKVQSLSPYLFSHSMCSVACDGEFFMWKTLIWMWIWWVWMCGGNAKLRWHGKRISRWWSRMCRWHRRRPARFGSRYSSLLSATLMLILGVARYIHIYLCRFWLIPFFFFFFSVMMVCLGCCDELELGIFVFFYFVNLWSNFWCFWLGEIEFVDEFWWKAWILGHSGEMHFGSGVCMERCLSRIKYLKPLEGICFSLWRSADFLRS